MTITYWNERPDTWCSAKVLACHAAGPGSIPSRGNKDALISHKSITWSLGIDLAPSFGARLDKLGASPQLKTNKTNKKLPLPTEIPNRAPAELFK